MPKVTLLEAKENNPWKIQAVTCEKPDITLGAYKQAIGDIKSAKKNKIWVPGQGENKHDEEKNKKVTLEEILDAVYQSVKTTIASVLIEQEVNRLLSDLIDQTKKLGLTVEQYLASTNRTAEGIRQEYSKQAQKTLTLEFALEAIADKEGIFVSDDDINKIIQSAKTDDEKKTMERERYYLASILRRQKTIDTLANME
jgi:FKBP-type peptidyl-prolyl cis-trans isomerase (trigger factor)